MSSDVIPDDRPHAGPLTADAPLSILTAAATALSPRQSGPGEGRSDCRSPLEDVRLIQNLYELAPLAMALLWPDGSLSHVNARFRDLFGYHPDEIPDGRTWLRKAFPDKDTRQRVIADWIDYTKGLSAHGGPKSRRFSVTCGDGSTKDIHFDAARVGGETYLICCEDITEFTRTESALRLSREMLAKILSASPVAISYIEDGRLVWTNPAMVKMFGYDAAPEYIGKHAASFYASTEKYQEIKQRFIAGLPTGRPVEAEVFFLRKNGELFLGHLKVTPVDVSGHKRGSISVIADISEKVAAESRLRESEERYRKLYEEAKRGEELYRSLLDSSTEAVVVYDMNGRARFVNDSFTRMFGWTLEEIRHAPIPYVPESEKEFTALHIRRLIDEGTPCLGFETKRICKDGRVLDVSLSASRYHDHLGNPAGMLVTITDVTEKKRLEEQLRQAAKMDAIGRLAGGVAHDFNNLLTVIMGHAELLLSRMPGLLPYRASIREIAAAAERAAELTRQLLAFSRKQILDVKVIDLNRIIGDLESILRRLLGVQVELIARTCPALHTVKADRSQVEQILLNLVVNAKDAMPQGGLLTIETQNVTLGPEYAKANPEVTPGDYVLCAVSDTGHGMAPDIIARIFDPFFTTKPKGVGTGLGLATVYGIVKQHQGHVAVYSEPNKGTTFKVYFPAHRGEADIGTSGSPRDEIFGGHEVILLVEDEEAVRLLAAELLEMMGYTVLPADCPATAVDLSRRRDGAIDLLLSDVVLPGMDGRTLFEKLRVERPDLRVVFMSGYTEEAVVRRGVLDPGVHFLQKPFNLESLAAKVREALDETRRA
jgi:PAS domain S-box-containing protein